MSPSLRRLMKEAAELSSTPSPHFCAHPVSDSNMYDWHFTLAGPPPPSPYSTGIYHGRIVLPPTYPLRPPSFRFLTPSGRFEVNREICLSISGHHEETWQPAWGIRTALLAIRSFMDADPKGQVGGLDASEQVRREWAQRSRGWKCEVCSRENGGKTNEEILRECKEEWTRKAEEMGRGQKEEEEEEIVPEELRNVKVAYRDGLGGSATGTATTTTMNTTAPAEEMETEEATIASAPHQRQLQQQQQYNPSSTSSSPPVATPPTVSGHSSTTSPQGGPSPSSSSSSSSLTATTTSPLPSSAVNTSQPQDAPRRGRSSNTPLLDTAIIVVVLALVLMIMRRIANSDDL